MDAPEVHAPHAPHTGHRWLDMVTAGTAVIISLISLYVAVEHGHTMEKLVAANSWPNVELGATLEEGATPGSLRFALTADNNGVGPARVETVEVWVGGKPVPGVEALVAAVKAAGGGKPLTAQLDSATLAGSVLGARETRRLFALTPRDRDAWATPLIETATRLETRLCYCSVFDECYLADTRATPKRPVRIDHCPVPAVAYSEDSAKLLLDKLRAPAK